MNNRFFSARVLVPFVLAALSFLFGAVQSPAGEKEEKESAVHVVIVDAGNHPAEEKAARELSGYIRKAFPKAKIEVKKGSARREPSENPTHGIILTIKCPKSLNRMGEHKEKLQKPGSYVIASREPPHPNAPTVALIHAADAAGLHHAVYDIAQRLGFGFELNGDIPPKVLPEKLTFKDWATENQPLTPVRMVFNWHNFLSGCSSWNLDDWNRWIDQSQKMGFNTIMVHSYGNNPMAGYEFRGTSKPVGYLSSTSLGREWATMHVNDVRRLIGGDLFDGPVFGSTAAIEGTDPEKTAAAREMMGKAFRHADQRGVDVYFAVDLDTPGAYSRELIMKLPESARFQTHYNALGGEGDKIWLVNPDTPEGYEYYKSQVSSFMKAYPTIDCLVVWFRSGGTPMTAFKYEDLSEDLKKAYQAHLEKNPEAKKWETGYRMFMVGRVIAAWQRAAKELGYKDLKIGVGSWHWGFLDVGDHYFPKGVPMIPLDYMCLVGRSELKTETGRAHTARIGANRPLIPVAWAHHDDGQYVGPPYKPNERFQSALEEMKVDDSGFGILHWTSRPLDLYFRSLGRQVWSATRDEPLEKTCRRVALEQIGPEAADQFARYLQAWVTGAPMIGRETGAWFIDRELKDMPGAMAGYKQRMQLLDDAAARTKRPEALARIEYHRGIEAFIIDVFKNESHFRAAQKALKAGDRATAIREIKQCNPEKVIARYAKCIAFDGGSRGESGFVVSLNTRWLPHYIALRQNLGLAPVRCNFAPTVHEVLARRPGSSTFYITPGGQKWNTFGHRETGLEVVTFEKLSKEPHQLQEIARDGVLIDKPFGLQLNALTSTSIHKPRLELPAGRYEMTLWLRRPIGTSTAADKVGVQLEGITGVEKTITMKPAAGATTLPGLTPVTLPVTLEKPAGLRLVITPEKGKVVLCGYSLSPIPVGK